jgi:hypothetical protein
MRVILAGIKVQPHFVFVTDTDELQPDGRGLELQYNTLTEFASQAAPAIREAWEQLRQQAAAPAAADPSPESQ